MFLKLIVILRFKCYVTEHLDLDLDDNLQGPYGAIRRWVGNSLRARRHKLALELVQGASLCHNGRKLIPVSHGAVNELVP